MAGISSLGIGSGIDIRGLVDRLLAAEQQPAQQRLDRRETRLQAEISSYGILKSALGDFQNAVAALSDANTFRDAKAISADSDAIAVTANGTVDRAAKFDVQVLELATSQSLASNTFTSPTEDVGAGTLTFRFGTVTTDTGGAVTGFIQNPERATATVAIPAGSSSLEDVQSAVNDAEIGIRASIVNDGTGERLVFNGEETGAANGFVIDVVDDDGDLTDGTGLSQLAFNEAGAALAINRAGQDASLVVDGLKVSRPDNVIDDLLDGASITLSATTTAPAQVSVEPDISKARSLIQTFVESFNELQTQIEAVSGYDAESGQGGVLQGDALVRSVAFRIRGLMTQRVDVLDQQSVRALADVGILTTREGTLEVDSARLNERLDSALDEVGALFGKAGIIAGAGFLYESSRTETVPGTYGVNVTQLAEQAAVTGIAVTAPSVGVPLTIDANNDELSLTIDGIATGAINLTQGDYTSGAAVAAELQARINGAQSLRDEGVTVGIEFDSATNQYSIRSTQFGSDASVSVETLDIGGTASFGFAVGQNATGLDVAGTIGGQAAEGFGRFLTGQNGATSGLKLEVTATAVGSLGSVTFSRGISDRLDRVLSGYLGSDGPFDSVNKTLKDGVDDVFDERIELDERLTRLETRLVKQFSAMDALVAQLNQTSSFLTTQLTGLEALSRNSNKQ